MPFVIQVTQYPGAPFWVTYTSWGKFELSKSSDDAATFSSQSLARFAMESASGQVRGALLLLIDSETNEVVGTFRDDYIR
jgi:hypothetical protein